MIEFIFGFFIIILISCFLLIKPVIKKIINERNEYRDKYNKVLSQKKSSEIRLGKIGENMAPFVNDWPYDPSRFRFIGNPVDGIQFTDEEIIFVEIKTGKSRLTKSQKRLKNIILGGNVKFATFRIGENGAVLHVLDNDDTDNEIDDDSIEED